MGRVKNAFQYLKINYIYFLLAVIGITAFFAHETIASEDWSVTEKGLVWKGYKTQTLESLSVLKNSTIGTPEHDDYLAKSKLRDEALIILNKQIDESKFLGFRDFQQFLGEFGWALGLFIYGLSNLILTFIRKTKTFTGEALWHTSHISIAVFFIRWSFNKVDFLKVEYFAYNIITVVLVVFASYFFVRYKTEAFNKLQKALNAISHFAYVKIKDFITDPDLMEEYKKESIETLKNGMK